MDKNFTKIAFTDGVKKVQERYGSRQAYARMEASGDKYQLTAREIPFIESRDHFFMSTVGENGWPYVQYRGGPKGFLKVIDNATLGFANFRGNRQYISVGNMNSVNKAALILMDYPSQQRLKIWAETKIVDPVENSELKGVLVNPEYKAQIERFVVLDIQAFDWNCPQHITPRFTCEEIADLDLDAVKSKLREEKKGCGQ